jgi:hypothetical protein
VAKSLLLKVAGNAVLTCDASLTKFPINASMIVFSNASVVFATPRNRPFGADLWIFNLSKFVILYEDVTIENTEPFWRLNTTLSQIGNLTVPRSNDRMFCVSGEGHSDCFSSRSLIVKSLIVNVPSVGNSSMKVFNDATSGFLKKAEGVSIPSVFSNRSFVAECHFVADATATAIAGATATASETAITQFSASGQYVPTGAATDPTAFRRTATPSEFQKPANERRPRL